MESIFGLVAVLCLKLATYVVAGAMLNRATARSVNLAGFALFRGGLGWMAAFVVLSVATASGADPGWGAYICFIPVRLAVWALSIAMSYGIPANQSKLYGFATLSTAWSYLMDAPMFFFLSLPGVVHMC